MLPTRIATATTSQASTHVRGLRTFGFEMFDHSWQAGSAKTITKCGLCGRCLSLEHRTGTSTRCAVPQLRWNGIMEDGKQY